jgi:dihydroorotase
MLELGNVRLHDGAKVFIQINDGLIQRVTSNAQTSVPFDCKGWTVAPAGIDGHVHFRDEEEAHKEDWETGSSAALRGGYTLVADMPNKKRPNVTYERLIELVNFIGKRRIDYRMWFGATADNLGEILQAVKHPCVLGPKVYRGSSTGNLLVEEDRDFWKIGEGVAAINSKKKTVYIATHNENEKMMRENRAKLNRTPQISDHCKIRDTEVELSSVKKTIQMQRDTGCPVYYCHISTPESLEALHSAKQEGLPIVVEVCVQHMVISDMGDNPFGKVNPPLRTPAQVIRMSELVSQNDFADVIASDHAPHKVAEKMAGDYDSTPSGLTGIQTTIPLLLNQIANGRLSWQRFMDLTSGNYSKIFGFNRGKLEPGFKAELVFVDPGEQVVIRNSDMLSKCGWTPYDSMPVRGSVKAVFTDGTLLQF